MGLISNTRGSIKSADEVMRVALGDILEKTSAYIESNGIGPKPMNVLYEGSRDVMHTLDSLVRSLTIPLNIEYQLHHQRLGPIQALYIQSWEGRYVNIEAEGNWSFWLRVGEGNLLWRTLYDILIEFADDEALYAFSSGFRPQDMK